MNAQVSGQLDTIPHRPPSVIERAAAVFVAVPNEDKLKELAQASADILTITNQAGLDQVHSARMALKNQRLEIERTGEAGREDAVQTSKAIIAWQKKLVDLVKPEETRLAAIQKAWDDRIAAEKEAKIQQEIQRVAAIQKRIEEIRAMPLRPFKSSSQVDISITEAECILIDESFAEFAESATNALQTTRAALKGIHADKLAFEAEQQRIQAEREELAKLRAEQAEREKVFREAHAKAAAEAKAESDAEAARQAEANRIERERIAAEEAAAKAVRVAEARAHADQIRLEREALAAEKAESTRIADEQRAAAAAEDKRIAEARAALEAEQAKAAAKVRPKGKPPACFVPTQQAIIEGVAAHFKTDAETARGWMSIFDWRKEAAA